MKATLHAFGVLTVAAYAFCAIANSTATSYFHPMVAPHRPRALATASKTPSFSLQGNASMVDRSVIYAPEQRNPGQAPSLDLPIPLRNGPHLLLDDYLIASSAHIERKVMQPQRSADIPNPIVNAPIDHSFQPYLTVLKDPETGRYRMWYGIFRADRNAGRSLLATMESRDGIHFERPHQVCETPEIAFGSEVIDRGKAHPDPTSRYAYSYWFDGGTRILVSANGLQWRPLVDNIVVKHDHDISSVKWDERRQVYSGVFSSMLRGKRWSRQRRTTLMSVSKDLIHWEEPWLVLTADDSLDEGDTQFYAMEGFLNRGGLRIGMVKILRDDLRAAGTEPGSFGLAHTALAWSRDGKTWIRDRAKFFEPDGDPKAWDHAHAWIDEQLIVGDSVYLYYAGYKQGHKQNRFQERQIGLVKMPLDRYVARRSQGDSMGLLKTVPMQISKPAGTLRLNINAKGGQARVQVVDAVSGEPLPGLSFADCLPLRGDGLREAVRWRRASLERFAGRTVQIEFELTRADLFAFECVSKATP